MRGRGWLRPPRTTFIRRNEIARYEQELRYQSFKKKTDGWYFGDNVLKTRAFATWSAATPGTTTSGSRPGARRTRWRRLLAQYAGAIDLAAGQSILADKFDVYLMCANPLRERSAPTMTRTPCST
jgi:hypothetical protein